MAVAVAVAGQPGLEVRQWQEQEQRMRMFFSQGCSRSRSSTGRAVAVAVPGHPGKDLGRGVCSSISSQRWGSSSSSMPGEVLHDGRQQ